MKLTRHCAFRLRKTIFCPIKDNSELLKTEAVFLINHCIVIVLKGLQFDQSFMFFLFKKCLQKFSLK